MVIAKSSRFINSDSPCVVKLGDHVINCYALSRLHLSCRVHDGPLGVSCSFAAAGRSVVLQEREAVGGRASIRPPPTLATRLYTPHFTLPALPGFLLVTPPGLVIHLLDMSLTTSTYVMAKAPE